MRFEWMHLRLPVWLGLRRKKGIELHRMTVPALLLAFLIASLYGALYHLLRGGGPGRLLFYLLLAWVGFGAGYFLGLWRGWRLVPLGPLDLGLSTLGSLFFLLVGDWLGRFRVANQRKR